MMTDRTELQRKIDDLFRVPNVVSLPSSLTRTLEAARKGDKDPALLADEDIQLVCRTLLFQYAQMGID